MTTVSLSTEIHPDFSEYVVKLLSKNRIGTVFEFVRCENDRLIRITNFPFEQICAIKLELTERFSGNNIQVPEYFRYLSELVEPLETRIHGLDLLLEGGLLPGHVLEVCGDSATGKTQLCTTIALNVALKHKFDVFYVDTKCDFSVQRCHQMLKHRQLTEDVWQQTMDRIKVERIFSPEGLICAVESLLETVDDMTKFKLLIIDSLPSLWYMYQNSKSNCYPLGTLTRLIGILRKLASENLISVVLVNLRIRSFDSFGQSTSKRSGHRTANGYYSALGRYWETAPTTRLLLCKLEDNESTDEKRWISVWKSNYLKTKTRQIVTISDRGVL
ncbi:DNA repair protein RAD51 homolog 4 [Uranotaenia lowii]|uniref:DNA repair protein RAD51 homolog 4 n=1 Tax=Uranotaenia lowii TaxID=190385 RepID=UPI002478D0AC|nr:DNA repair protein RAD51 homolog 4 [Uranotaenia lowii]